jgi:6-pyruvoyltetrahydropterin/6-carboxytetrahydropterin synthase
MIRVTRRYRFSASHRLHSAALTESENRELYGKCNSPYGHGHDYLIEVSARGPRDRESGLALNTRELDRLVEEEVLLPFQHRNLNLDVPAFADLVPTTENLAAEVRRRLSRRWSEIFPAPWPVLDRIRIHETRRNAVELPGTL